MISLKVCRCSSTSPPGNPGAIIESIQRYLRQEGSSADNPLQGCQRVKVLRLGVLWAEELNLPWAAAARKAGRNLGQSCWTARLRDGTTPILKP
jgi:hypothetical protein